MQTKKSVFIHMKTDGDTDEEETREEVGPPTSWALSVFYTHYYKVWSKLIFTTIIPLLVLIVCNTGIFVALKQRRDSLCSSSNQEWRLCEIL